VQDHLLSNKAQLCSQNVAYPNVWSSIRLTELAWWAFICTAQIDADCNLKFGPGCQSMQNQPTISISHSMSVLADIYPTESHNYYFVTNSNQQEPIMWTVDKNVLLIYQILLNWSVCSIRKVLKFFPIVDLIVIGRKFYGRLASPFCVVIWFNMVQL